MLGSRALRSRATPQHPHANCVRTLTVSRSRQHRRHVTLSHRHKGHRRSLPGPPSMHSHVRWRTLLAPRQSAEVAGNARAHLCAKWSMGVCPATHLEHAASIPYSIKRCPPAKGSQQVMLIKEQPLHCPPASALPGQPRLRRCVMEVTLSMLRSSNSLQRHGCRSKHFRTAWRQPHTLCLARVGASKQC